jgi:hypothetical protein
LISIRPIAAHEWQKYRDIRLRALKDSPDAFGSTWEREILLTDESWSIRIAAAAKSPVTSVFRSQWRTGSRIDMGSDFEKESNVACLYQMWWILQPAVWVLDVFCSRKRLHGQERMVRDTFNWA